MNFSLSLFPLERWDGLDNLLAGVRRADELDFVSVAIPEHVVNPQTDRAGARLLPSDLWFDPFVLATLLARETTRLRLHLSAVIVPYHHPLDTAKAVASLDQISHGRVTVTAAAGWMEQEFEMLGVPYGERAARTSEYLRVMKMLWEDENVSFAGRFVKLTDVAFEPKCVQAPHVKLWGGGSGRLALQRVVELCDGWAPMRGTVAELSPSIEWLRENMSAAGRDPGELELWTRVDILGGDPAISSARGHAENSVAVTTSDLRQGADEIVDIAQDYARVGFAELGVSFPWRSQSEFIERLEWLAEDVRPALAPAVG